MTDGWIFVMQMGGLPYIKVVFSTDVISRRRALEQSSPLEILLLAEIPGTMLDERKVHERLRPWCTRGEWYAPDEQFVRVLGQIIGAPIVLNSTDDFMMEVRRRFRERLATLLRQKRQLLQRYKSLMAQQTLEIPEIAELDGLRDRCAQQQRQIYEFRQYEDAMRDAVDRRERAKQIEDDQLSRDIRETMRRAEEAVAALEADELPEPCWAAYT